MNAYLPLILFVIIVCAVVLPKQYRDFTRKDK
jgi:hypothetical protein